MNDAPKKFYDVVIVGSGIAGGLVALKLGKAGKQVLVLEAGGPVPTNINTEMDTFYRAIAKVPESPYTPDLSKDPKTVPAGRPTVLSLSNAEDWRDPSKSYLIQTGTVPFSSTYERTAGGTSVHWLGTSLRLLPNDFKIEFPNGARWPRDINYQTLEPWYHKAEEEIGVSGSKKEQSYTKEMFFSEDYPMPAIPPSRIDQYIADQINGMKLGYGIEGKDTKLCVRSTPAARNSQPFKQRRTCAGNTNCIPICPIQAKYDPTITLRDAQATGKVDFLYRTVASEVVVGENERIDHIKYLQYGADGKKTGEGRTPPAKIFVIAAHAIETPRLLRMSTGDGKRPKGVANSSDKVGRNLMDHPMYVPWGLLPESRFPYRGPLSTSGIEDLRDGDFRKERASFRIEIGNEGWNFAVGGDPNITTVDLVNGLNNSLTNPKYEALHGDLLVSRLGDLLTRQFRLGFLVEQEPEPDNRVTLSQTQVDGLGLPRPEVRYSLSDYTIRGLAEAKRIADLLFGQLNAVRYTRTPDQSDPTAIELPSNEVGRRERIRFMGAGHILGTYRMGDDPKNSVVDSFQQSHDHKNLYLIGSGVFPTSATANPTLTIAALCLRTAEKINDELVKA